MEVLAPIFRARGAKRPVAENPERLYDEMPPRPTRPGALWAHQADVLRTYVDDHLDTPDIALELPTGAGKTIPGLLITDWRRQHFEHPALYACPTQNSRARPLRPPSVSGSASSPSWGRTTPRELARAVVAQAGKALVLAPPCATPNGPTTSPPPRTPVHGPKGNLDEMLETFRGEESSVLTLAARYDGLDLPDAQCRVTVLDGMPRGEHLQERFLSETLLARRVLRERQRTRVIQGAGRCSRGLSDYSVVVVLGDPLTRFLTWKEVCGALRPELQAEVAFGRDNSTAVAPEELQEALRSFLAQDTDWFRQAEPALREMRHDAAVVEPAENAALAAAARHEVRATSAPWNGTGPPLLQPDSEVGGRGCPGFG
jgi:hypothetical protein